MKPTYVEKLLLEGNAIIHEVLMLKDIPEELRIKLSKWRMAVDAVTGEGGE